MLKTVLHKDSGTIIRTYTDGAEQDIFLAFIKLIDSLDSSNSLKAGLKKKLAAVYDSTSGTFGTQIAGTAVDLDYVLGILYDEDAIMTDFQIESSATTPLEARKRYRNIWWSFAKNSINDFTENAIIFTMEDPSEGGDG